MLDDNDKTMMPRNFHGVDADDFLTQPPVKPHCSVENADKTLPGKRDRKPDGRFDIGDLIMNRYKVLSELGQGGMGVVYKCFDETAGVEIALKALPPELSHNTLEMEDIRRNFQIVHNLHHPNIASYNNLERDPANGNYYLIMECCEGADLRHWIRRKHERGTLNLAEVIAIVRQVAAALDYAHKQRIIHRDIKPGNIMIDIAGEIKVLDFGLAAQIHTSMTRVSMANHGTSGTAPYMSPEQWRGRRQDARADQYALAVMTYEMLAGYLPFESPDPIVLKRAVLDETPEPIENIPDTAMAAINKAMSKEPAERFASCGEFAAALGGFSEQKVSKPAVPEVVPVVVEAAVPEVVPVVVEAAVPEVVPVVTEAPQQDLLLKISAEAETQGLILSGDKTTVIGVKDKSIQHFQIPYGVTSIGWMAFSGCKNLTSINIPDSVTSIEVGAFRGCKKLTSINIPCSVASIEDLAFLGCKNLTSINIPDGVTSIESSAFEDCENLTSINIPNSVTSIGVRAFDDISIVTLQSGNPVLEFDNSGVLINKETKRLIAVPKSLSGSYVIPASVTSIEYWAFSDCENLTSINIPDSVTSIGVGAFSGCKKLTSINIPNSVTSIGDRAFSGCKNLTNINIPDSVTSIGWGAFSGCKNLTNINIPDSVTSIGGWAFSGCKNLSFLTRVRIFFKQLQTWLRTH